MSALLLKKVFVIDAHSIHNGKIVDILIENGIIKTISQDISADNAQIISFPDACVSVGWCDMRVSSSEPGNEYKDDWQTLAQSAAFGGFTDIAVLPNTNPVVETKESIYYIKSVTENSLINFHPIAAVTKKTAGEEMTEMTDLHYAGAVAFSDGLESLNHSELIKNILLYLQPFDGLFINQPTEKALCKHGQMHEGIVSTALGLPGIPSLAEEMALRREIALVEYTKGKIHFSTISSAEGVAIIREAKKKGLRITADVSANHLYFTDEALTDFDTYLKVNPPFRTAADVKALWEGIADGTIDAITTAHQPQDTESKRLEFDLAEFGALGLETAFSSLLASKPDFVSIEKIIEKLTHAPRTILKLTPLCIEENMPAVFTVFDTETEWIFEEKHIQSKSKNSPMVGKLLKGSVKGIINGKGKQIFF
jgi:dihydroorotase